ncbi:MAG: FkbM family methyltransferase [Bacteroidia bacterium]|nr:FkbM family methyltransferase [Bacteroidia bacterium]
MKGLGKVSFSQAGEDRIIQFLFNTLGISRPSYLDIGANHPVLGSNSYLFYIIGSKGVCVEPEPNLFAAIKKIRKRDTCLNIGIGVSDEIASDFFIFPDPYSGWNTFSREEAQLRNLSGHPYKRIIQMPLKNINDILGSNFKVTPDFISIDVEGLDFQIIQSLDFEKYQPKVLLVETIRFGDSIKAEKQLPLIDFICSKGYFIYADTGINTIFCRKDIITK